MKVIIVGGSITGLLHGIMLKHHGCDVHIIEKSSRSLEAQAAGVGTGLQVKQFLDRHDRLKTAFSSSCRGIRTIGVDGGVVSEALLPRAMTSWDSLYYRLRANFDGLPSPYYPDAAPTEVGDGQATYETGLKLVAISADKTKQVVVQCEDTKGGSIRAMSADLVVGADGPNSTVRSLLCPSAPERRYAGYVLWRGLVPEKDLPEATATQFDDWFCTFPNTYKQNVAIIYNIPGRQGSLEPGQRDVNFAWYSRIDSGSLAEALTDINGHKHHWSVPLGKMRPEVWAKQLQTAGGVFSKSCEEVAMKVKEPFLQVISDYAASQAVFCDGKVLLVGDALALFRPHTGLGINQAAFDAIALEDVLFGKGKELGRDISYWEKIVLEYAHTECLRSISWGEYYLGTWFSWAYAWFRLNGFAVWKRVWSVT